MKKKLLSVLLCGAMVAGCLTGCGSKAEEQTSAPADAAAEETADTAAEAGIAVAAFAGYTGIRL